jgi:hypothetical protein
MRLLPRWGMVIIQARDFVERAELRTGKRKDMVDRKTKEYALEYG